MAVADQLIAVGAVLAGAAATYVVTRLSDRDRFARELRVRWDQRRLEAYVAYVREAKAVGNLASGIIIRRIRGHADPRLADRIAAMADAETRRGEAFEALPLLAGKQTILAAHELNRAVWALERPARKETELAEAQWRALSDGWIEAMNNFHGAARDDLSIPGTFARLDATPFFGGQDASRPDP